MKLIITGGLGHIGSYLLRQLPKEFKNLSIHVLDNLSTQRYCSLFSLPENCRYKYSEGDILTANLNNFFKGAAAVIHLAAITDAELSFEKKDLVLDVNYRGTRKVASACLKLGIPLLFPSTTSVYGPQDQMISEECGPNHLKPQSPYAQSKLMSELTLRRMRKKGLRYTVLRLGTISGPSVGMRFHTAVNKFCWQAVQGLPLTVWRSALHQRRPYLDLTDAGRAIVFLLKKNNFKGETYNVVTGNHTVEEIIQMIRVHIPDAKKKMVNSKIMNQLSYEVLTQKFKEAGFVKRGRVSESIGRTISMLRQSNLA